MPVIANDIRGFRPANISNTTANGGTITRVEITDVVGALFPNVPADERAAGSVTHRKFFFGLANADASPLIGAMVYLDAEPEGADTLMLSLGTATDTQATRAVGDSYGVFSLQAGVVSGASTVQLVLPSNIENPLKVGMGLRVTTKASVGSAGVEEFVTITEVSASSGVATVGISPPLNNPYPALGSKASTVCPVGDLVSKAVDLVKTSVAGAFDVSKVLTNNKGTVGAGWTLTFSSAMAYTLVNTISGGIGTFNRGNTASPNNPDTNTPYLAIPADAFSGTFSAGDVVSFTTVPAAVGVWLTRHIPAGAAPTSVCRGVVVLDGGSY